MSIIEEPSPDGPRQPLLNVNDTDESFRYDEEDSVPSLKNPGSINLNAHAPRGLTNIMSHQVATPQSSLDVSPDNKAFLGLNKQRTGRKVSHLMITEAQDEEDDFSSLMAS